MGQQDTNHDREPDCQSFKTPNKPSIPAERNTDLGQQWLGKTIPGTIIAGNAIAFFHVPLHELRLLDPGDRNLRISAVRVNAFALGLSSSQRPTQVVLYISVSDVTVVQPQRSIAAVSQSFGFVVSESASSKEFESSYGSSNIIDLAGHLSVQKLARWIVVTFSGVLKDYEPTGQRTRLLVEISGVPSELTLFATTSEVSATPSDLFATLTEGSADGSGLLSPSRADAHILRAGEKPIVLHRLNRTEDLARAIWELDIIPSVALQDQKISLGIVVAADADCQATTPKFSIGLTGDMAPLSTVNYASPTAPVPRFAGISNYIRLDS